MTPSETKITTHWDSLDDCKQFAARLAKNVVAPITIRLDGTLGAGKTQFTKFFAEALGANSDDVTSPTFVLIHRYETNPIIYHLDAYRVGDEDEFLELGVEELFEEPAITLIEWGEKYASVLPRDHLVIAIDVDLENSRVVEVSSTGPRARSVIDRLQEQQ
jgi:tRNA threonylcarbamoyladenosine biosynthesis protein TsaE